jgi:hypothetical protein
MISSGFAEALTERMSPYTCVILLNHVEIEEIMQLLLATIIVVFMECLLHFWCTIEMFVVISAWE